MATTNSFDQRQITLPIASEGDKRKITHDVCLAFSRIYAVSSPNGRGGKGARVYTKEKDVPLHTAQTFAFKNWQEELERKNEYGFPVYRHNFISVGPRLMVNMDLLRESYLDLPNSELFLPPFGSEGRFPLEKDQITFLTQRLAEKDNSRLGRSMTSIIRDIKERNEYRRSYEMTMGCVVVLFLAMLVNTGLLIAILCILLR